MSDEIPPYPLCWPDNMPRTPAAKCYISRFKATLPQAVKNVSGALRRFGEDSGKTVSNVVATTNVGGIHLDGDSRKIDPGVAVWFDWDGMKRCIAVDRYPKPEDNLQAIYYVIEARRTEARHGGLMIARTAFRGFIALPNPESESWHKVLELDAPNLIINERKINEAYRRLSRRAHPDASTGSNAAMARLNKARDEALREIGA